MRLVDERLAAHDAGPSRFFEENHEKPYTGQLKAGNHTNKQVVGVGRITNPDTMVAIIQSGQFDIGSIRKENPKIDIGVMMIPHP